MISFLKILAGLLKKWWKMLIRKTADLITRPFRWAYHRIKHKLEHISLKHLKELLKKNGLALVVIFIVWEIIEDILFPLLFLWLGKNVNPWFYSGAPFSWLMCVHPIAVPVIWRIWIKFSKKKLDD